jgi:hypothetical protein
MAPQHGRIIHAHIQGLDNGNLENQDIQVEKKKTKKKKTKTQGNKQNSGNKSNNYTSNLVIRLSEMYSFERAVDAPFDLFVRYLCSFPVGDTTSILTGCSSSDMGHIHPSLEREGENEKEDEEGANGVASE